MNLHDYLIESLDKYNSYDKIIKGDAIILYNSDELIYTYEKDYVKFDFNKGFNKIILSENAYKNVIKHLMLHYDVKKMIKVFDDETIDIPYTDDLNYNNYFIYYKLTIKEIIDIDSYEDLLLKLKEIKITQNKPKLLLHSCCGPCSSNVLVMLSEYFDITISYYNPNIYPKEEYLKRLDVQKQIVNSLNLNIKIIEYDYEYNKYLEYIKGFENCGEKGRRCYLCYQMRLLKTCLEAVDGFDYFTTTISISPYKVSKWLNEIGKSLEKKYGVKYLYSDFKKDNGYLKSINLSKKYDLYRQDYCGCEFSIK